MRSLLYTLLSLATITTVWGADQNKPKAEDDWEEKVPETVFNGQKVPPMKELDSVNIEKDISKGNW
jgi:protein disulfide-isomerase